MRKMLKKTVTAIGIGAFLLALQPFTTKLAMKNGRKIRMPQVSCIR